ncbi:SHOCT domain-containing protein [Bifidobacterium dentium]
MNDEQFEWESSTKQAWGMFRRMLEKRLIPAEEFSGIDTRMWEKTSR